MTSHLFPPLAALLLTASAGMADVPKVMTDFAPVQSLAAQVMGDLGTPAVLVERGSEPHSYQMRPSQARALAGADLVVWVGPELTPWMERALNGAPEATILPLLSDPATLRRTYDEAGEHSAEEGTDEHSGEEEDHDHHGTDPHAWLDPANAKAWVLLIRDALVRLDPDNAATYRANADQAAARIEAMQADVAAELAGLSDAPLIMGHDAYGYFADRFGLTIAGTIEAGDAAHAGAAHLTALRDKLRDEQIRCLFPEAGHDPKQAALLLEGTNTRLGESLDPEGVLLEPGPDLYETLIRSTATAILSCVRAAN